MKIYTRTGDDGSTGLFGGDRVEKSHPRIRAYGTVDEANSMIGFAIAAMPEETAFDLLRNRLTDIQHLMFVVGADLATPLESKASVPRVGEDDVGKLEAFIDEMESRLEPLTQFIVPGGHLVAAALHMARTTCRRAEREVVEAMHAEGLNPLVLKYLNRLSDTLFVAARLANHLLGQRDVTWNPESTRR